MSEQLIDLLKLGLLALLYLFFLRVIWAVWTELRAPAVEPVGAAGAPAVAPKRQRATRTRQARGELTTLRVLEPAEMAADHPLAPEMTMGTTGRFVAMAWCTMPFLSGSRRPSRARVPSGKSHIDSW